MTSEAHVAEILLRRQRAGELEGAEREGVLAHTDRCAHCRARLSTLEEEQRAFERQIPFERFSAGVERAARESRRRAEPRARWLYPVMAAAAAVTLVTIAQPVMRSDDAAPRVSNRVKGGGAGIELRIAMGGGGPQRAATPDAPEPIIAGEHLRLAYRSGGHPYVTAVTVDAEGVVGPLHPEAGGSETVTGAGEALQYLPAFELTGRGPERVVLILSDAPLGFEDVRAAAEHAFEAAGRDVTRMGDLAVKGEQFHRTLLKQ
jgi:hypothetical protein